MLITLLMSCKRRQRSLVVQPAACKGPTLPHLLSGLPGCSKKLKELHYAPGPGEMLDDALLALNGARSLKVLQLHPCGSSMSPEQLRSAGQLNLR